MAIMLALIFMTQQTNIIVQTGSSSRHERKPEQIPLTMNVINLDYLSAKSKETHRLLTKNNSQNYSKLKLNRYFDSGKYSKNLLPQRTRICFRAKKQSNNDEINFSDYKIKFGSRIEEEEVNYQIINAPAEAEMKQQKQAIVRPSAKFEVALSSYQESTPKKQPAAKRYSLTKKEKRAALPTISLRHSNPVKRRKESDEWENKLDGWGNFGPFHDAEKRLDIIEYTKRFSLQN